MTGDDSDATGPEASARREAPARRLDGSGYDPDAAGPYVYDLDPDESPSTGVVMAVAALCGTPTAALEPLYEAIDPDALDRIVDGDPGGTIRLTFSYAGTTVTVDSNRTVRVDW